MMDQDSQAEKSYKDASPHPKTFLIHINKKQGQRLTHHLLMDFTTW